MQERNVYLIGPMGSLYLDDPLLPQNPTAGLMYVTVDGDDTVAFSRTINLTETGATFGQGMPGVLLNDATLVTEYVLPMVHSAASISVPISRTEIQRLKFARSM